MTMEKTKKEISYGYINRVRNMRSVNNYEMFLKYLIRFA